MTPPAASSLDTTWVLTRVLTDVPEPSHSCSLKRCVLPGPACQERPRLLLVLEVTVRPLAADGPGCTTGTLLLKRVPSGPGRTKQGDCSFKVLYQQQEVEPWPSKSEHCFLVCVFPTMPLWHHVATGASNRGGTILSGGNI